MSARLIRRFAEIVALVENGELEQGCNEAVTKIFESLEGASEGAKASLTLKLDFVLKNGIVEFGSEEPAVKVPKRKTEYGGLLRTSFATPARMMELSVGLQVFVASMAKSGVKLQSGEGEIQFAEEHRDATGNKLVVPGLFMVSMPAFIGGESVRIPVRLRYRVKGGAVVWLYEMYRWKEFLRERVLNDLTIAQRDTTLPAFEGTPE